MTSVEALRDMAEAYKPGLYELEAALTHLAEDAPEIEMLEAYWLQAETDFSTAGFVGCTLEGVRIYLEVACNDDTPEREVKVELQVLKVGQKYPAFEPGTPSVEWSAETHDLNLLLDDYRNFEGEPSS
jgi:hypothetical protein